MYHLVIEDLAIKSTNGGSEVGDEDTTLVEEAR